MKQQRWRAIGQREADQQPPSSAPHGTRSRDEPRSRPRLTVSSAAVAQARDHVLAGKAPSAKRKHKHQDRSATKQKRRRYERQHDDREDNAREQPTA